MPEHQAPASPPVSAPIGISGPPVAPAETRVAAKPAEVASRPPAGTLGTGQIPSTGPRGGYQVRPSYPATARGLGVEGTTLLRVLVQDDGRVGEVRVQKSAGHPDLDRAAADAVRQWRFDPARRGDAAVAVWVLLPVEFHLSR